MRRTLLATLFFVTLVTIWHFIVQANIWSPVLLPSPRSVGEYLLGAARDEAQLFGAKLASEIEAEMR